MAQCQRSKISSKNDDSRASTKATAWLHRKSTIRWLRLGRGRCCREGAVDSRVFNGGLRAWARSRCVLERGDRAPAPGRATLREAPSGIATIDDAARAHADGNLVDVRTPARSRGSVRPHGARADADRRRGDHLHRLMEPVSALDPIGGCRIHSLRGARPRVVARLRRAPPRRPPKLPKRRNPPNAPSPSRRPRRTQPFDAVRAPATGRPARTTPAAGPTPRA